MPEGPSAARALPLVCAGTALACLALAASGALPGPLALLRGPTLDGQWWRLWSGHLVHYTAQHALLDALALFLFGAIAERAIGSRRLLLELLLAAPAISLALLASAPALIEYRGASGLATFLAGRALPALWRNSRPLAQLLGLALLLRTIGEALALPLASASLPPDVLTAWPAHAFGLACAALAIPLESADRKNAPARP